MRVNISSRGINVNFGTKKIQANISNVERVPIEGNYKMYEGEYNITPLAFEQQELETKNKILEDNLIVKEVPYFEVSNIQGTTVYIGSEV